MSFSQIILWNPYGDIGCVGVVSEMGSVVGFPYTAALDKNTSFVWGEQRLNASSTLKKRTLPSKSCRGVLIESETDDRYRGVNKDIRLLR